MTIKKYAVVPLIMAAALALVALPAFAESGSGSDDKKQEREHKALTTLLRKSGPSIHIGSGGRAQIDAAIVTRVEGDELSVKLFGLTYVVNTGDAEMSATPAVDARVWIKGKVNESTGEIDAVSVRTFTAKGVEIKGTASTTPMKLRGKDTHEELKALMEKLKALRGNQ